MTKPRKHAELIKQWADDDRLEIEVKLDSGENWGVAISPVWHNDCEYRIKPIKPSIDWSHVADEYHWLAVDADKEGFLFSDKPSIQDGGIWDSNCYVTPARTLKSFEAGTCDWRDSLVKRHDSEV